MVSSGIKGTYQHPARPISQHRKLPLAAPQIRPLCSAAEASLDRSDVGEKGAPCASDYLGDPRNSRQRKRGTRVATQQRGVAVSDSCPAHYSFGDGNGGGRREAPKCGRASDAWPMIFRCTSTEGYRRRGGSRKRSGIMTAYGR